MQFKSIIFIAMLSMSVVSCSSVQKIVYRIDVPQGNYLEASKVKKVSVGMTTEQVQYLLGTPMLVDPFNKQVWHYVFLQQKAYQKPEQHTFVVTFNPQGVVIDTKLDQPLPNKTANVNNVILDASKQQTKHWWQFWK